MKVLLLLSALLAADPIAADAHLISGAQHFRAQAYAEALVEFQVAQKLGAEDAGWYVASALVKLEKPAQALVAFAQASEAAPEASDALLEYYRGLACYQERLYVCADAMLAAAQAHAGPKIAGLVEALRQKTQPVLTVEPTRGAIDFYLARAQAFRVGKQPVLATLFAQEAQALAKRRKDAYRRDDATSELTLANAATVPSRP